MLKSQEQTKREKGGGRWDFSLRRRRRDLIRRCFRDIGRQRERRERDREKERDRERACNTSDHNNAAVVFIRRTKRRKNTSLLPAGCMYKKSCFCDPRGRVNTGLTAKAKTEGFLYVSHKEYFFVIPSVAAFFRYTLEIAPTLGEMAGYRSCPPPEYFFKLLR